MQLRNGRGTVKVWSEGTAGTPTLRFSAPPEFQGEVGIWSPEDFFLAAIVSCFITTFRAIAEFSKFDFDGLQVSAEGVLQREQGGYKFTEVFLCPALVVHAEQDRDRGQRLLEKAERSCLISRSIQAKVVLEPNVQSRSFAQAD